MSLQRLWLNVLAYSVIQFLPDPFLWRAADPQDAFKSIGAVVCFMAGISIFAWWLRDWRDEDDY